MENIQFLKSCTITIILKNAFGKSRRSEKMHNNKNNTILTVNPGNNTTIPNNVSIIGRIGEVLDPQMTGYGSDDYGTDDGSDLDMNEPIGDIDLEIVGLYGSSNGRSCCVHGECGRYVKVGDLLRLKRTVATVDGREEDAVKLVKISDGVEGCTVAFIPRLTIIQTATVRRNLEQFCVVKSIYEKSSSNFCRQKSFRSRGMAGVVLLNDIPRDV
jgi:hypothetical protein